MIKSMTGYGLSKGEINGQVFEFQVKTINNRFLEVRLRLPREFQNLEMELRKLTSQNFDRGTIEISLQKVTSSQSAAPKIAIHLDLAKSWQSAVEKMSRELDWPKEVYHHYLTQAPQIIEMVSDDAPDEKLTKDLMALALEAFEECNKDRAREGKNLLKVFETEVTHLEKFSEKIEKSRKNIEKKLKSKLSDRLGQIDSQVKLDPVRLSQEVLYWIDKTDVSEEVVRLGGHLQHFSTTLKKGGVVGKKLDFLTQELLREVNTIGSKIQDADMGEELIGAKTAVERIKEQVQNIQ